LHPHGARIGSTRRLRSIRGDRTQLPLRPRGYGHLRRQRMTYRQVPSQYIHMGGSSTAMPVFPASDL
jgi:hypothetical protein